MTFRRQSCCSTYFSFPYRGDSDLPEPVDVGLLDAGDVVEGDVDDGVELQEGRVLGGEGGRHHRVEVEEVGRLVAHARGGAADHDADVDVHAGLMGKEGEKSVCYSIA